MNKDEFWMFVMGWLASNASRLVELLNALVPVLALCLVGYAMWLVHR